MTYFGYAMLTTGTTKMDGKPVWSTLLSAKVLHTDIGMKESRAITNYVRAFDL